METKKQPARDFRLGAIRLSIWENESENGFRYYRATLGKSYRLPESERTGNDDGWRDTGSFAAEDLPVIVALCQSATRWFCREGGSQVTAENS